MDESVVDEALRAEVASLRQRVAALEDAFAGFKAVLATWGKSSPRQSSLIADLMVSNASGADLVALRNALMERFEQVTGKAYVFEGAKDAAAVKRLAALRPDLRGELVGRWEECLRAPGYPGTKSLALFVARINHFGKKSPLMAGEVKGDPYAGGSRS